MAGSLLIQGHWKNVRRIVPGVILVPQRLKSKVGCDDPREKCKKPKFSCPKPQSDAPMPEGKKITKNKSMWENPFCDETKGPCPVNPRFDDLYWSESDKAKRLYWQTWVSCPKLVRIKKVCNLKEIQMPPIQRRPPPKIKKLGPEKCPEGGKCPRIPRECSRKVRCPTKCVHVSDPSDCKKPLAPYPAFSECLRLKPGELPLSECLCWQKPMMCEVWIEYRKRCSRDKNC